MRYAAYATAVFGAAMFMAPGSHAPVSNIAASAQVASKPVVMLISQPGSVQQPFIRLASQPLQPTAQTHSTAADTQTASSTATPLAQPVTPVVKVTVQPGNNLSTLAAANNTTYRRLYDANPAIDNPDLIYPGQELRLPTADETLAPRELPVNAPASAVTEAVQAVAPARSSSPVSAAAVSGGSVWDQLALCESGGNWAINTGNGFYGGIQFTLATWQGLGGTGLPSQASREEQIAKGEMLLARSGWGQWPACSARLGLR